MLPGACGEVICMRDVCFEMWAFLRIRKKFWLAPIVVSMTLLGALFVFAGQAGVISPFIYML